MLNRLVYLPQISLIAPDLDAPWIQIQPVAGAGLAWRCALIHHLTAAENGGNHHVYVDLLGPSGQPVADPSAMRLGWTWVGKQDNEAAPPAAFDKRPPEPATNVAIFHNQILSVWVQDVYRSDIVANLRTDIVSAEPGNSLYHHSYYIAFQIAHAAQPAPTVTRTLEERVALTEARLATVNSTLHLWND